ncbi:hypothetical protein OG866_20000 [Streptomyces sp. NBC_00663]|uniref:hypothetical protein n=1 Tax=Streptomyces sp. NBC_00663 TaxID=2975801 RepID=UPI002E312637|nr:hypothetical protein [Streptomyces sp. NBC_00663]
MTKKALVGVPAALLLILGSPGAAHADDGYGHCNAASDDAGGEDCTVSFFNGQNVHVSEMDFYANGERMFLRDHYADGRGIVAEIGALSKWWANTGGAGTTYEAPLPDITEGQTIAIKVCQTDNGSWLNCVTVYATA